MKVKDLIEMLSNEDGEKEVVLSVSVDCGGMMYGGESGGFEREIVIEDYKGKCIVNVSVEGSWEECC